MPYTNAMATPRSDIYALVQQANSEQNKLMIGDQIFPVKGEDVKRGIYMKANLANAELLNIDVQPRESGTAYNRVNRKYDIDTFDAQEYGLEATIDDSYESEVERFMNLEANEAGFLESNLRRGYEARVAAAVFTPGNWFAAAMSPTAAYTAANIATIDVVNDVDLARAAMFKTGIIPNAVVMSYNVYQRIRRSTLLQNQIYGVVPRAANQRMLPGEKDVAEALGVEKLLVGKAAKNANTKGQSFSGAFIWADTYIAVMNIQGGEYQSGGAGRTIQWTKDTTGLFTPETYRDDKIRSNILRVRQHVTEKVIDATCCQLITTSYA